MPATISQEVNFLLDYSTNPSDYKQLRAAYNSGVISNKSRSKKLQELHSILQEAEVHPVWFDYRNKRWNVIPIDEVQVSNYTFNIAEYNNTWAKAVSYGDKTLHDKVKYNIQTSSGIQEITKIQKNVMFGLEIEMHYADNENKRRNGLAYELLQVMGGKHQAAIKYDGSVSDGIEVVCVPKTYLDAHKTLSYLLSCPITNKYKTSENTGFHVHVSRQPFTYHTASKLFYFVHCQHNNTFMRELGARESYEYCRYYSNALADKGINSPVKMHLKEGLQYICEHYAALSVSQKHPTFEFRFAEMSLDKTQCLGQFEFIAALCQWVRESSINAYKYEDFLTWLADPHSKRYLQKDRTVPDGVQDCQYHNLHKYLNTLGYKV